ncbi:hypothetical protein F4780DRAFT_764514 [Xylariomycetidae sp. FL0641]|nr:hypothetical protein F4780DRAFT_764514 [Xylariomycetidae sp. FL0641]
MGGLVVLAVVPALVASGQGGAALRCCCWKMERWRVQRFSLGFENMALCRSEKKPGRVQDGSQDWRRAQKADDG